MRRHAERMPGYGIALRSSGIKDAACPKNVAGKVVLKLGKEVYLVVGQQSSVNSDAETVDC